MKHIGLIDVDSKIPDLALMKISAFHKSIGNEVMWYDPFEQFDEVYMSKIFHPERVSYAKNTFINQ